MFFPPRSFSKKRVTQSELPFIIYNQITNFLAAYSSFLCNSYFINTLYFCVIIAENELIYKAIYLVLT